MPPDTWPHLCPSGQVPPQAGAAAMLQVLSLEMHVQLLPPGERHVCPSGHSPPQPGASECRQFGKHKQLLPGGKPGGPQNCPVGHVPPQAGHSENLHVLSGVAQAHSFPPNT